MTSLPFIPRETARQFVNVARWCLATASIVATDGKEARRFAWSALVGVLTGFSGSDLSELLGEPEDRVEPVTLEIIMSDLTSAMRRAFDDGPPSTMFAGEDADEAWGDVTARFIVNVTRANLVILYRAHYDALVKRASEPAAPPSD